MGESRSSPSSSTRPLIELIENTDDAYGFPPFSLFAPMIKIDGLDYEGLRRKEAELLRSAISGAARWHLRVEGHEWADRLPAIIDRPPLVPVGPGRDADSQQLDVDGGAGIAVGPAVSGAAASMRSVVAGPSHVVAYDASSPPEDPSGMVP